MVRQGRHGAARTWRVGHALCAVLSLLGGRSVEGDDYTHKYKAGDSVIVWVNKVGPWYNPQEAYPYHRLPFCVPDLVKDTRKKRRSELGEVLTGNQLRNSGIDIKFREPQATTALCEKLLDGDSAAEFRKAVEQDYLVNMFVDDLPIYGSIGKEIQNEVDGSSAPKIFVHQKYTIAYNGERIIRVTFEPQQLQPLNSGTTLYFTYEVGRSVGLLAGPSVDVEARLSGRWARRSTV